LDSPSRLGNRAAFGVEHVALDLWPTVESRTSGDSDARSI
jgi:hypothetical protein